MSVEAEATAKVEETIQRVAMRAGALTLRIAGKGTSALAVSLLAKIVAIVKSNNLNGQQSWTKLLKMQRPLSFFKLTPDDRELFTRTARDYRLMYAAVRGDDGNYDLAVLTDDVPRLNRVFEAMRYGEPERPDIPPPFVKMEVMPEKQAERTGESRSGQGSKTRASDKAESRISRNSTTNKPPLRQIIEAARERLERQNGTRQQPQLSRPQRILHKAQELTK